MNDFGKRILSVLAALFLAVAGMPFAVAAQDGDGHTHQYTEVIVVEPGYLNNGYTIHRCACGDSYSDTPTPQMTQPVCTMSGGRVIAGETVAVQAHLYYCTGLADLAIDLDYNNQVLHLTDAQCAEYGAPERVTDNALYFETIDPAAEEAVLYLYFTADENASAGEETITISGCGRSGCPVDNGGPVFLTVETAAAQVYRPVRLTVTAPAAPLYGGDTVQMKIDLCENTGLAGMVLDLQYNPQVLALTDVQKSGMFASGNFIMSGDLSAAPFRIMWDDAIATANHTESGTILTLTFRVQDSAPTGTSAVSITFDPYNVLDMQMQPVETAAYGASLSVIRRLCGDADGDENVDLKDVTCLSRYLAQGWNVTADPRNSDVNADGLLNLKDVILLRRYLAGGWGVVLQ